MLIDVGRLSHCEWYPALSRLLLVRVLYHSNRKGRRVCRDISKLAEIRLFCASI